MDTFDWKQFLKTWSEELIAFHNNAPPQFDDDKCFPPAAIATGWLGYPGATDEQITDAEARLGTVLPPSYKAFLKVSNGWRAAGPSTYKMWSTERIDWFKVRNADWIDGYTDCTDNGDELEPDIASTLEISEEDTGAIYLLNPTVVTPDGEWEAWFFANWIPGSDRYQSFQEMMIEQHDLFLKLTHEQL